MWQTRIGVTIGTGLALCTRLVIAHPGLVSSTPNSGELLDSSPKVVQLRFNEPVEPAFSGIRLVNAAGKEVLRRGTDADSSHSNAVVVHLPELSTGVYRAIWSAMGRDGHRIKGEFSFSVK